MAIEGYFRSFDRTKLFYRVEGEGPTLVFCYGLVCSILHWQHQVDHFKKKYRTIWFDYRGHHRSQSPKSDESLRLEDFARDTTTLMDRLKVRDAVLLGHSMGVNVVLEVARQNPDRVKGLVLANGTPKRPLETLLGTNAFQGGFRLLRQAHELSPEAFRAMWRFQKHNPLLKLGIALAGFNPHLTPLDEITEYINQVTEIDPRVLFGLLSHYDSYDSTGWLHEIQAPALVVSGSEDKIIPPPMQELLQQLLPQGRLVAIRHGSHCSQMDLPELFNREVEVFLRAIGYGQSD